MSVFAHLFGIWFATVLIVPWLLVAIFPMVILLVAIAAFANDFARNRREREAAAAPPREEPRGPLYVGMTYRRARPERRRRRLRPESGAPTTVRRKSF